MTTTSWRKRRIPRSSGRRRKCSRISAWQRSMPYRVLLRTCTTASNQRAPMPQLVMAGSGTGSVGATSPPPAAFQPALRILKRPTASPSSSSSTSSIPTLGSGSSNSSSGTYAEREARYQAARDRIFGDSSPSPVTSEQRPPKTQTSAPKSSPPQVQITREPKGPPAADADATSPGGRGQDGDSRGFGSRRGKRRGAGGKP